MNADGSFDLAADAADAAIQLHLVRKNRRLSMAARESAGRRKARATLPIITRSRGWRRGRMRVGKERFTVSGESWFDHEWATNQLGPEQAGWNWVSAQFEDGTELMLYQMRLTNGAIDPISSGTFVRADGTSVSLTSADFQMTPEILLEEPMDKGQLPDWMANRGLERRTGIHSPTGV